MHWLSTSSVCWPNEGIGRLGVLATPSTLNTEPSSRRVPRRRRRRRAYRGGEAIGGDLLVFEQLVEPLHRARRDADRAKSPDPVIGRLGSQMPLEFGDQLQPAATLGLVGGRRLRVGRPRVVDVEQRGRRSPLALVQAGEHEVAVVGAVGAVVGLELIAGAAVVDLAVEVDSVAAGSWSSSVRGGAGSTPSTDTNRCVCTASAAPSSDTSIPGAASWSRPTSPASSAIAASNPAVKSAIAMPPARSGRQLAPLGAR